MNLPSTSTRRRNETRDLLRPIMAALNALDGVRVWRPHVLNSELGMVSGAGLAVGSADLVGIVTVYLPTSGYMMGRWISLEVKWPGRGATSDQRRWGKTVQDLGGFWAVVHSVEEAREAVERCRMGQIT